MQDNEQYDKIIVLLEAANVARKERDQRADVNMSHLQEDLHTVVDTVSGIKVYFTGLDPSKHIIDHIRMVDLLQMQKDIEKVTRMLEQADLVGLHKDFKSLEARLTTIEGDKSFLKGGWAMVALLGSLLMGAVSIYKTFHG
jgi:predicted nuclease with TOPRIM domain